MAFQLIKSVPKLLCIFGLIFLFVYLYLTSSSVNVVEPYDKIENTSQVVIRNFPKNFCWYLALREQFWTKIDKYNENPNLVMRT